MTTRTPITLACKDPAAFAEITIWLRGILNDQKTTDNQLVKAKFYTKLKLGEHMKKQVSLSESIGHSAIYVNLCSTINDACF